MGSDKIQTLETSFKKKTFNMAETKINKYIYRTRRLRGKEKDFEI